MLRTDVLLPLSLLLAGACASLEEPEPPCPEVPESWAAGPVDEGTLPDDWWRLLGDEQLSALVEEALRRNPDIHAAAARLDAALARARAAGAELLPEVTAGFEASRARQNLVGTALDTGDEEVFSTTSNQFGASLSASWEIDLWGRLRAAERATEHEVAASAADLAGARLSISAQVVRVWVTAVEARLQLDLAQQTLDTFRSTSDQVRSRFEEGLRTSLDLRLALSNVARAVAEVALRERALDETLRQLEILMGRYPARRLTVDADLPSVRGTVPAGLPADLIARRPDLAAAERRFLASSALVAEAKADRYPAIRLTGSAGRSSGELGDLLDGDFTVWRVAAGIVQPLFDGGRRAARVSLQQAGEGEGRALFVDAALAAYGEVETALAAEGYVARRQASLEQDLVHASAAERLALEEYGNGLTEFVTVLEAQQRAFQVRRELLTVKGERVRTRVDLIVALGGGYDVGPDAVAAAADGKEKSL